ncbi:proline-specific peptidase [Rhizodiscina lignyota]|uniref:Proline-specific peptidase n=1 Tax=Rhizodiscina lignyota TaxID=1504668 RepID=A0A9P4IP65_9PEZI|nr:proline-specific peptidase [Rhizodiscina lignyota]
MTLVKVPVSEGNIPFKYSTLPKLCYTWYRLYGTIKADGPRPLVVLHGGPGVPHNYMESLKSMAYPPYNRPVIMYDQLGCGKSTHIPEMNGDKGREFWTVKLFLAELENVVKYFGIQDSYDVLGNSWGGMLGAEHAITQPKGLNKLVVADSPADMVDWVRVANGLRKGLPKKIQETLERCEREGKTETKEYEEAVQVFYDKHVCRIVPNPEDVQESFRLLAEDNTVYLTMNGPSEFFVIGTLKYWNIKSQLHMIKVPVLLINGKFDEAQDECVMPYFQGIEHVKWVHFAESAHMPHWEERDRYMQVVGAFLDDSPKSLSSQFTKKLKL